MPYGVASNVPDYGANQIIATSTDSMFFEKVLNNLKLNNYVFETVDRVNGFVTLKPKKHPDYTNSTSGYDFTMTLNLSYIKDEGTYKFVASGTYYHQTPNITNSGQVIYTKAKSSSRRVWDEFMRQFEGIPGLTFSYRRI